MFVRLPVSRWCENLWIRWRSVFCPHASSNLFHTILKCLPFSFSLVPPPSLCFALSLVPFSFASLHPEVPFLIEQSSVGCFPLSPPPFSNISPSDGFSHSLFPSFFPSFSLYSVMPSAYSPVTGKYYAISPYLLSSVPPSLSVGIVCLHGLLCL